MQYNTTQLNSSARIVNVYYSRAMDGFHYEKIQQIYKNINNVLKENNLILLNDNQEFLPHSIIDEKSSSEIVENNMKLLEKADCVIVDLSIKNHSYIGCIDEMVCANLRNIFVIVICGESGVEKRPYTNYRANKIVKDFDEAVECINKLNSQI